MADFAQHMGTEMNRNNIRQLLEATYDISLKFTSFCSFSVYCPGPESIAFMVFEVVTNLRGMTK